MADATKTLENATDRAGGPGSDPLRLRFAFGPGQIIGPGRVELLRRIEETGSLSAAGRAMRMSYKRAWSMVEELNRTFDAPLVSLSRGGSGHGGAVLTPLGREVAARYGRMLERTKAAVAEDFAALAARLAVPRDA